LLPDVTSNTDDPAAYESDPYVVEPMLPARAYTPPMIGAETLVPPKTSHPPPRFKR
jgi:hypothetical protein